MRIYVASSWRNPKQPEVIERLRSIGHEVYDFRNPSPGNTGFSWSEIDPNWQDWDASCYLAALDHPLAEAGFHSDFQAMEWADVCVLVQPCGRSAHLEMGWFIGRCKTTIMMLDDHIEPELMVKMCDEVVDGLDSLTEVLS